VVLPKGLICALSVALSVLAIATSSVIAGAPAVTKVWSSPSLVASALVAASR